MSSHESDAACYTAECKEPSKVLQQNDKLLSVNICSGDVRSIYNLQKMSMEINCLRLEQNETNDKKGYVTLLDSGFFCFICQDGIAKKLISHL